MSGYAAGAAHSLLACRLPAVDKGRGSKSVEVQRVWEVYVERVQFMSRWDASQLDESLGAGDVSRAWLVWSRAAETALADAYSPVQWGSYSEQCSGLSGLVVTEYERLVAVHLMSTMLLVYSCTGTLLLVFA